MSDKKCSVTVEVELIESTNIKVIGNATFVNNKFTIVFEEDGGFTVLNTERNRTVQIATITIFNGVETTQRMIGLRSGEYLAYINGENTCFGMEGEVARKIFETHTEQKEKPPTSNAGLGYFAMKMVLVGDTKITSKYPLIEKNKEVVLVLTESAQFSIETTEKQTATIVMVGAGQPGTDTTGGVAGEMIEKTIELETGDYYVSIGKPKLYGKTTMASILDGSKYVFLAARSGTEMSEVLERKEINICSIEEYQAVVNRGGIQYGCKIQDSPVGAGHLTDVNGRGYPMVNHVTVVNFITEDGIVYGDYVEWIMNKAKKQAKENNMVVQFLYKNPNPNTALEIPGIGPINDFWYLEGFGPMPDAKFCERYKVPMTWKIDFGRPDTVTKPN